jgi:TatD DNase family protein
VYAAVGLHPIHTPGGSSNPEEFDFDEYKALASSSKKVVAVGETGIDFFHDETNVASQAEVFKQHIRLAKELDLAVIIHGRNSRDGRKNAYAKIYEIVKAEGISRAVVHCYGGTWEEAQRFVDLGLKIGFTGIITFPKTQSLADIARRLSAEQILIETDCPYLAPEPHRGQQNMPQYVRFVAEKIAEIRGISYNEIAEQTRRNAEVLFNIS